MSRTKIFLIILLVVVIAGLGGGFLFWKRSRSNDIRKQIEGPRVSFSCASLKNFETGSEFIEGSWGNVPENLRILPPGAQLCGFIPSRAGTVVALQDLKDQVMFDFYRDKVLSLGCEFKGQMIAPPQGTLYRESFFFACDKQVGSIFTFSTENAYMISWGQPATKPTPSAIPTMGPTPTPEVFVPPTPGTTTPPNIPSSTPYPSSL